MTTKFTTAGAMVAITAVSGNYFIGLGTGETPKGLIGEATASGYGRQSVTIVASGTTGSNADAVSFAPFGTSGASFSHVGLFTAARGGTCVWVGPLPAPLVIDAGRPATIPAGTLRIEVTLVGSPGVAKMLPSNTGAPSITGTAQVGRLLTAAAGTWSGTEPIAHAFRWQRGTTNISGATGETYVPQLADVGATLRVMVVATNEAGSTEVASAPTAAVIPVPVPPTSVSPPVVSGTARAGQTLTTSTGSWSGTEPITYSYQWQRGSTNIVGATAGTYAVQTDDVGATLRVVVTGTNAAGSMQATSANTASVTAAPLAPSNTAAPTISGSAQVNQTLTATSGTWSGTAPISYAYQWQRGSTNISGATSATYTAQAADVGATLRVVVTATNSVGTAQATSAATATVAAATTPPANTALPAITGTAQAGQTLTASTGTWSGTTPITYAYQWQRGSTNISGATSATYTAQAADVGATLRVVVTATNSAGTAQATSTATTAVTAASAAPANTALPAISGSAQVGQALTASSGTWSGTAPITYAYQWQRGSTNISGATSASYTTQGADAGSTLRVIVTATNGAGSAQATSAATAAVTATPAITIATPISPQPTGSLLLVSGTFTGTMSSATLVWRQGSTNVGSPVSVSTISGGTWSHTIGTPAAAGTYTLRVAFNGGTPTADSSAVTITVADTGALASVTFDGTGEAAGTVALFGHAFPQGAVRPSDPVVIRRGDDNTQIRTQMHAVATWPDGSIRTATLAAELPALANAALLPATIRKGEAHPSPGSTLTWSGQLTGRTVVIRTWAPGNTTTPLWTYDVRAAILASAADSWMSGPLALSARAKTSVPSSAVQNTAGATGSVTSVRLVVDLTTTKDGLLLVDAMFANDAMHKVGGGTARFGWTIEVDGAVVYDQRPASGAARDLLQYNAWIRRRARKGTTTYDFHTTNRPFFRPDFDVLVDAGFTLFNERSFFATTADNDAANQLSAGAGQLTNPYFNWGLNRFQGDTGGATHIGPDTKFNIYWMAGNNRARDASILSHLQAEAMAIAGWLRWDEGNARPVMADEWPRWDERPEGNGETAGVARGTALGYPVGQLPVNNHTDHIVADMAHRGDLYTPPALLSGRRMLYDMLAQRGADAVMGNRRACWNGVSLNAGNPTWRGMTPNHTTGVAWGQTWPGVQLRAWAWSFRCLVRANFALPDATPRRDFYGKSIEAYINAIHGAMPHIKAIWPDMGLVWIGYGAVAHLGFHGNFLAFALAMARRLGWGGENFATIDHEYTYFRAKLALESESLQRRVIDGWTLYMYQSAGGDYDNSVPLKSFAAVSAQPTNASIAADWSNSGHLVDYATGMLAGFLNAGRDCASLEIRALAREALVRMRSHRVVGTALRPRFFPSVIGAANNGWPQIACVGYKGVSWRLDKAPVVTPGQVFTIDYQVPAGTLLGCVDWTGPIPRNSTQGLNAPVDAWEIVSQPTGNPFTITAGGAIRRSATGTVTLGDQVLQVRCRTYDEDETLRLGTAVAVTVRGTAVAPSLTYTEQPKVSENAATGTVVTSFTYDGNEGTPAITAGNTNTLFDVAHATPKTVQVRVARSLAGYAGQSRTLTVQVTNAAGSATTTCPVSIIAPVNLPTIAAGQEFTIAAGALAGASPNPASVAIGGGTPDTVTITSGGGGVWAVSSTGALSTTAALGGVAAPATYTPVIEATNLAGSVSRPVTIRVTQPSHIWSSIASTGLFLEMWSVARVVATGYTGPLIRVRRASDNAEQDIGSTGGLLNTAALTSFVGSSQGFVTRIYGQLYSQQMVQPDTARQLEITAAGGTPHVFPSSTRAAAFANGARWMICNPTRMAGGRATHAVGGVVGQNGQVSRQFLSVCSTVSQHVDMITLAFRTAALEAMRGETTTILTSHAAGLTAGMNRLAAAARVEAGATAANSVRMHANGGATGGSAASTIQLGSRNVPNHSVYVTLNGAADIGYDANTSHWSEVYFCADISQAHLNAVIAEQRAFYGF